METKPRILPGVYIRIDSMLDEILNCDLRTEIGIDKAKKHIKAGFLEQDQLTRRACADGILKSEDKFFFDNGCSAEGEKDGEDAIMVSDAIEIIFGKAE